MEYINESYEELTESEADFLINLYETIRTQIDNRENVTLISISSKVGVRPAELVDYLPNITEMIVQIGGLDEEE